MDGFLGTRASFMLDVVFLAMFLLVPALLYSVYVVKVRRRYALHKHLQIAMAAIVGVTVAAFEVEMRLTGWQRYALPSPYYSEPWHESIVGRLLTVHLFFSISTVVLWIVVMARALRHFRPPAPGPHSRAHIFWARLTVIDTVITAVTGCVFYYLAFCAK